MGRAPCCEKVGLNRGRWTKEEDEILGKYIQANGEGSWRSLPKNAGLLRCGKSCRLRWINYLRTDIKRGNISLEEESTIVKLHASFGNRWSLIASHLPGRTDNEIKNYWNSNLSRKIYNFRGTSNREIITLPPKCKRRGRAKNKTYAQMGSLQSQKQIHHTSQNNEEAIPLSPTPTLESDNLMDFMVLDLENEELSNNVSSLNNVHHHENTTTTQEENMSSTLVQCFEGEREINDNMLGPYEEAINEGEALSLNDVVDNWWQEVSEGLTLFGEERGSNDVVVDGRGDTCINNRIMVSSKEELYSSSFSSMVLGLEDDNWDWESVVQLEHTDELVKNDQETILNWLCEDEDWEKDFHQFFGEIDPGKQNAMVDWFLS